MKITIVKPIIGVEFKKRWFELACDAHFIVDTDKHIIEVKLDRGFKTDGRSGGPLIDPIFPQWGTQFERCCVVMHDVLYHRVGERYGFGFDEANKLLYIMIKHIGYSWLRAKLVYMGVDTFIAHEAYTSTDAVSQNNLSKINIFIKEKL